MHSHHDVIPTTIGGIKGLAKKIKKQQSVSLSTARGLASQFAGFQNYDHAVKVLEARSNSGSTSYKVFITFYWVDDKTLESGRETLEVIINTPLRKLLTPHQLALGSALSWFKFSGSDHIVCRYVTGGQDMARKKICHASRQLQFINAMHLKPGQGYGVYPENSPTNIIPRKDHSSIWQDDQGRYVFMDEPYHVGIDDPDRLAWAKKFNQSIELSPWPSIYYPEQADMFLVSSNGTGVPLKPIIQKLENLSYPDTVENWRGESGPYRPVFMSPDEIMKLDEKKALAIAPKKIGPRGQRKTISNGSIYTGYSVRPKGKMSLADHSKVAQILLKVLADCSSRDGVANRIDYVRGKLDGWGFWEYRGTEEPSTNFSEMYYAHKEHSYRRTIDLKSANSHIHDINVVKDQLKRSYPECAPLNKLITKLDLAISSLQRWTK